MALIYIIKTKKPKTGTIPGLYFVMEGNRDKAKAKVNKFIEDKGVDEKITSVKRYIKSSYCPQIECLMEAQ